MWIGWKAVSLGIVSVGAIAVALYSSMAPGAGPIGASIPVSEVSGATVAVSYTHLDVYKRQVLLAGSVGRE